MQHRKFTNFIVLIYSGQDARTTDS